MTVMDIDSPIDLRNLAIKCLGVFLSTKDNNMRYVSLNLLLKVVKVDKFSVQSHKKMLLECLHDPDISIRKRALDLSFAIVDERNIEVMTPELLEYLEVAEPEFVSLLVNNIIEFSVKFAPNPKWYIDTIMKVLKSDRVTSKEEIFSDFLHQLSTSTTDSQAYAAHTFFQAIQNCAPTMVMHIYWLLYIVRIFAIIYY